MKKIIALLIGLTLLCSLTACGDKGDEYSLSLGTVLSEDIEALTVTSTVAAVVEDTNGKIILCRLDSAESAANLGDKGVQSSAVERTKQEMGADYGMKEEGGAMSEWHEQARYFEEYAKGKTLSELEGAKNDDAELTSGCTIDTTDFIRAISAAMKSDKKVSFSYEGELEAGVALAASVLDNGGNAEFLCDTAATVVSGSKVLASVIDSAEATVTISSGKGDSFVYSGTKLELGSDYGMVEKGGAAAEWYVQAANYAKTANGKSTDALSKLPVENVSGCTIDAEPLREVLARAGKNVR